MNATENIIEHSLYGFEFDLPPEYINLKPIGTGAFGLVCSATRLGASVAIKKISKPFHNKTLAQRTFRELKLLSSFKHDNIISLLDVFESPKKDIYLVTEELGTDLQKLLNRHIINATISKYLAYQILCGLKYIHSADVVHRDLKPSNILVNSNCDLKICDFGLARTSDFLMTGYVTTRYYRAPDIMLSWGKYGKPVDIWSVGCILAEMLEGKPLFLGKDHIDQFKVITDLLGFPDESLVSKNCSENAMNFIHSLPRRMGISFKERFKGFDMNAIDLLERMLCWDSEQRITAAESLRHEYFAEFHDSDEEPDADVLFEWKDLIEESNKSTQEWKDLIEQEIEIIKHKNSMKAKMKNTDGYTNFFETKNVFKVWSCHAIVATNTNNWKIVHQTTFELTRSLKSLNSASLSLWNICSR